MTPYFEVLALVCGWVILVLVGVIGLVIIWKIFSGKINISSILNESGTNKASLSRLQFLIFTFVIALSLFLVVVGKGTGVPSFPPEIPAGIFALLGISGGTYVVSKGVEANKQTEIAKATGTDPTKNTP